MHVASEIAGFCNPNWMAMSATHAGGPVQRISLGINRADYMLEGGADGTARGMKMVRGGYLLLALLTLRCVSVKCDGAVSGTRDQVEINTIAAGLGPMTDTVRQMQWCACTATFGGGDLARALTGY